MVKKYIAAFEIYPDFEFFDKPSFYDGNLTYPLIEIPDDILQNYLSTKLKFLHYRDIIDKIVCENIEENNEKNVI